ncbi:glycosyltransferase family 39 protein [Telmatospirillum sp.]|uniref:ArnT family glycosyltransferase n=1 Tax=Telmatospirillum sp. TaxID=2079197 RepID=UPI00284B8CBF|nr:glycosyltransferase family 39 protein [Telmatospirillum sp.]MDR3435874.1 glycosyltransferase family 39 protein [Telmatospirillum sp.]
MQRLTGGMRPYLLLIVLSLALYLPGIAAVPPIDRDESRFAQASHQMLESGDYIRIKFQEESRAKKPVGIYWLQAASARLFEAPQSIWAYRLPSMAGALAAVLLTFYFGQTLVGRPAALIGAALLAGAFMLVSEAHQAKTDAVLLAATVAAQGVLGRLYLAGNGAAKRPGQAIILAFWVAQGVGILIKGPMVPMVSLLTLGCLWIADRRIGWIRGIRPFAGLLVVAAMVGPWAAAVSTATDGQFIGQAVKTDLLPKLLGAQESHGAPPGYYLLLMTATLWPASLFALPGFVRAVKARQASALRFCLAWIVPAWLVFEAVPTKLPHYVLPTYPALALLAGVAVAAGDQTLRAGWAKAYYGLWAFVGLALAALFVIAPTRLGESYTWLSAAPAAAALLSGLLPTVLAWRGRFQAAVVAALAGAVLTYGLAFQTLLPHLDRMWLSQRVAAALPQGTPVAAAGFHEPSLVFLLGTATRLTNGAGAADFLLSTPDAVAVVEKASETGFLATIAEAGRSVHKIAEVDGLNYSSGRAAALGLWDLESKPATPAGLDGPPTP